MKKSFWQRTLNILSGLTSCTGGILLIIKGEVAVGVSLITAGVTKMTAHEMQQREVKKVESELRTSKTINGNGL